jgi:hypothetical protein
MDESRGSIEADRQPLLAGRETEPETDVRFAGAGRASVMLPGVWVLTCRSSTRFILDTVTLWAFSAASSTVAKNISSSGNRTAH